MLARHLVLTQSHIPLAFSQSALSSVLVREKAGADTATAITKVSIARFFTTAGTMNSKRRPNYTGSGRAQSPSIGRPPRSNHGAGKRTQY
jgi:hypothetical protein